MAGSVAADSKLAARLTDAAGPGARVGAVISVDLFYEDVGFTRARAHAPAPDRSAVETEALAVEMECAALFAIGAKAGIEVGGVLAVSDIFDAAGYRTRIGDDALLSAAEAMGAIAVAALGA